MIFEIFGLPGTGKTTTLTAIAQNILKGKSFLDIGKHKRVFTSFYCKGCYKLDPNDLSKYDMTDSLILIDEISLYFDNRDFKNFGSDFLYFFKLHRHYNIDLVWCSQGHSDADKKIRDITDTCYLLENSRIPHYSVLKKIYHNYSFQNRQISDVYDLASRFEWKYINRKKYYKYFDSYEKKKLPKFDKLEVWE